MIIGITGAAGAGKDTVADYLVQIHGYTKLSFAAPLKEMLAAVGMPEPENRDDKEKLIDGFDFTWRQAAQRLGTEWGRGLDPDIWVKIIEQRMCHAEVIQSTFGGTGRFVLSDVRFENEAAMIRNTSGVVLHLRGRSVDLGTAASHISESGLWLRKGDAVIHNIGTLDHLFEQVEAFLREAQQ